MKKYIQLILLILSILILFILFFQFKRRETFIDEKASIFNPNYCESKDGIFIKITDPNDSRCLVNQTKKQSFHSDKMNPWGYRSCISNDQKQFGVYNMEKCYTVEPKPVPTSSSFSFNDSDSTVSLSSSSLSDGTSSTLLGDLSDVSGLEKKPYKKTCDELKLPNSSPCIPIEEFTNEEETKCVDDNITNNRDLNKYCQCLMKAKGRKDYQDFGASDVEIIDTNAVVNCKKYYYTTSTQLTADNKGIYDPSKFTPYKNIPTRMEGGVSKPNMTGCWDSDMDFDSLCSSVNNNQLWGAYKKLNGENGGCYHQTGLVNTNQSNAICSVNYNNELQKLDFPPSQNPTKTPPPNLYTKCVTIDTNTDRTIVQTRMNTECKKMGNSLTAYDIDSYDCPPSQFRAKCK